MHSRGGGVVDERLQAETDRVRMPGECVTTDWPVIWPTPGITHTLSLTHTQEGVPETFFSSSIILSLDVTPSAPFTFHHGNCPGTSTVNREIFLLIHSEQAKLYNNKGQNIKTEHQVI